MPLARIRCDYHLILEAGSLRSIGASKRLVFAEKNKKSFIMRLKAMLTPVEATPLIAYPKWLAQAESAVRKARPEIVFETIDPNFLFHEFSSGKTPIQIPSNENIPILSVQANFIRTFSIRQIQFLCLSGWISAIIGTIANNYGNQLRMLHGYAGRPFCEAIELSASLVVLATHLLLIFRCPPRYVWIGLTSLAFLAPVVMYLNP